MATSDDLVSRGEVSRACDLLERLAAETPALADVERALGRCYVRLGNPARARLHYTKYLELAPDASDAVFVKSMVERQP